MRPPRPFAVTLLAFVAGIAAVLAFIHTLQMLDLFPVYLGPAQFFSADLLGAAVWAALTLLMIWAVRLLWNLDARGWLLMALLSALYLVGAILSILGGSAVAAMMPALLLGALGLVLLSLPGVRDAFRGLRWA